MKETTKTHEERITDIESQLSAITGRLESHSIFGLTKILPQLEHLEKQVEALWMDDNRFKELEESVALLAEHLYKENTRKQIDSRKRPWKPFRNNPTPDGKPL